MSDLVLKVKTFEPYKVSLTLTTRINTAIDMLYYTEKFHTEQETRGPWDAFFSELSGFLSPYEVGYDISCEYFRGGHDVILEMKVDIWKQADRQNKTPLNGEHIAGTLLTHLFNHLEFRTTWYGRKQVVLFDENWSAREVKGLTLFAKK